MIHMRGALHGKHEVYFLLCGEVVCMHPNDVFLTCETMNAQYRYITFG